MSFYKTSKWKKKREVVMRRDKYLCRECLRYGKRTAAYLIHHIHPLEEYPEKRLDTNNLICLCNKCHETMHVRNTHELTDAGKAWLERKV